MTPNSEGSRRESRLDLYADELSARERNAVDRATRMYRDLLRDSRTSGDEAAAGCSSSCSGDVSGDVGGDVASRGEQGSP